LSTNYVTSTPATVLLEKIAAEKSRLVKEGKLKKQKPLPPIGDKEKPFDLPQGWEWIKLIGLGYTQTGGTPSKSRTEFFGKDIPFIKPGDIYQNYVDYLNEGLSFKGQEALGRTVPKGSVLMVCIGTIGKCSSIDRDCTFNQQINSITPYLDITAYLYKILSANYFQSEAWERSSSTTIAILNKGKWEAIPVPVAPLAEQNRIVAKVDELMALCGELEHQTEDSLTAHQILVKTLLATLTDSKNAEALAQNRDRVAEHFDTLFTTENSIDQLKQTILQLAVMGKLVPQDPNDEPASVLLEKIAKEKALLIKEGKIKKQKPLLPISDDEKPFDLPKGWEWMRLEDLLPNFQNGVSSRGDKKGEEIIVLRLADINAWRVSLKNTRSLIIDRASIRRYVLKQGDVLIIRVNGSADIVGRFILCDQNYDAIYCDHFIRMRFPIEVLSPTYLKLLGSSSLVRDKIGELFVSTAGQKTVNQKHIGSLITTLPPLAEQHRIVAKVDELMALCDQLQVRLGEAQTLQLHLADAIVEQAVA
jgi:type I restriction enzyme, S subunit